MFVAAPASPAKVVNIANIYRTLVNFILLKGEKAHEHISLTLPNFAFLFWQERVQSIRIVPT